VAPEFFKRRGGTAFVWLNVLVAFEFVAFVAFQKRKEEPFVSDGITSGLLPRSVTKGVGE